MNFKRQIERNKLRKKYGNKKLQKKWREKRIKDIGVTAFMVEYNHTTKSHMQKDEVYSYGIAT